MIHITEETDAGSNGTVADIYFFKVNDLISAEFTLT